MTWRVLVTPRTFGMTDPVPVGVNNVDVAYAAARGILFTNTPGANSSALAELAIALMMAVSRRVCSSDRAIRGGVWKQRPGMQLGGKTVGIVGTGQIGRETAELARGLRMKVICTDIVPNRDWAAAAGAEYVHLEQLIRESDYISLQVPYGESTRHLIFTEQFATMKPSAIIVNTSRGGIIDEAAPLHAWRGRRQCSDQVV